MRIFNSVAELIGNTPVVRLENIEKEFGLDLKLYAKIEAFNPGGSAKDRVGKALIEKAVERGALHEGGTVIEPTSGNTGIGLALYGTLKGFKVIIVMPDNMSAERIRLIKAYGAEIVLTPALLGMKGAIEEAYRLKAEIYKDAFIPNQFENPDNYNAHYETTGPEILRDTEGKIDYFIASIGTGGTITGTAKYLKEHIPGIKVLGIEPENSPLLSKGYAGSHKIQGIGANFVPKILDLNCIDEIIDVSDDDAFSYGRILARKEGILSGISSGAVLCAASMLAKRKESKGKAVLMLLPDTGERYLSSGLFD